MLFLIIATVCSYAVAQTQAQTLPGTRTDMKNVPSAAIASFNKTYAGAKDVIWYSTDRGYTAALANEKGEMTWVLYDKQGNPTGTGMAVAQGKTPSEVAAYLTKTGNRTTEIYEVKAMDGTKTYMLVENGKWIIIDSKGNRAPDQ